MIAINETKKSKLAERADDREIVATRVFDAPREVVFAMWTEPHHVARWWGPNGFKLTNHEMDVRPGGVWRFVLHGPDGTDYQNKIVYREILRPERIAYSHVSGPLFDVTVTFTAAGNTTRVDVRMRFESAAQRDKVAREFGAVEGLNQTLGRLQEELKQNKPFVISRTFDAPRELVFDVWTENEHLKHWFGPKGTDITFSSNDPRPGGLFHYCMRTPEGTEMWGKWVYREIIRPERLVFVNSFSDKAARTVRPPFDAEWPMEMLSTIHFDERDGKTTVTVSWVPINATDSERMTFNAEHDSMTGGWTGTFEQLDAYLAEVSKR